MSIKIAYQGRPGAYSHLACEKAFPQSIPVACETFEEAFEKTHWKKLIFLLFQWKTLKLEEWQIFIIYLPKTKLVITGEYFLKINHQLLGQKILNLKNIKFAVSHFHALAQCRDFFLQKKKSNLF